MLMNLFSLRKKQTHFNKRFVMLSRGTTLKTLQNYSEIFVKQLLFGNPGRKLLLCSDEWNPVMN